ncbi:hypothetical protein BV25DRAFT_1828514 [Artomyces pyxidatus]|uniref:Uncharacterized protein n=1 Tax=Artomyces pyxidatus TaxID=48021 RepID=A0ACB8SVG0_9AGAM|nr:hypothetical protein BV25DRAFT_1828514 [Artomyces pyxidatus]
MLLLLPVYASLAHIAGSSPVATPANSTLTNNTTSFALASAADDTCTDITTCRTRDTIIWSSLVTILACVWTAVHRNVPGPQRVGESRFWRIAGRVREATKIVVVTVLVPEWVLAWAVRQYLNARDVGKELERARDGAEKKWDATQKKLKEVKLVMTEGQAAREPAVVTSSETSPLISENSSQSTPTHNHISGEKSEGEQLALDHSIVAANKQTGRLNGKWTTRHGFSIIMGGYHYYREGKPQHPLSRYDVVSLVESGDLVPPTDEEIQNWSQSDMLSKALAITQTLWFVLQAIARRVEGLPITQLEVMTLAYTTITVAMYIAWWEKPQNVGGAVRIAVKELPPEPTPARRWFKQGWYSRIFYVIAGWQDMFVDLRKARRVPTFYGGGTHHDDNDNYADIIALFAAMVFGAVHCAAWHYVFPSSVEKSIWRISSLAIIALPGIMLVPILLKLAGVVFEPSGIVVFPFIFALCAPGYVAARLLLLAVSFTTLRTIPPDAYRAVQWTLRIPHFN